MKSDFQNSDGHANEHSRLDGGEPRGDRSNHDACGRQAGTHRRAWEGSQIRVQLADFLPVILQAAVDRSRWLEDFANEPLLISRDFHEVLSNYNVLRGERRRAG